MGTSQSSPGSPSNSPLIPPWVPAPDSPAPFPAPEFPAPLPAPDNQSSPTPPIPPFPGNSPIAPTGRFGASRNNLGRFARSGSSDDFHRGLGHYIGRGLGGANTAARRFGGSARTAGALYSALSATASGRAAAPGSPLDPTLLAGRSANEVVDAVIEAVRPIDGTQDGESSRSSIKKTLSELLTRFPDADVLNLSEPQRLLVIEGYIFNDVYNRFNLDVGNAIRANAPSAITASARFKEAKDFIRQQIAAQFRKFKANQQNLNANIIVAIVNQALTETFKVFEGYTS